MNISEIPISFVLSHDSYSLMMVSRVFSAAWTLGLFAFIIQIVLLLLIEVDRRSEEDGANLFHDVPFHVSDEVIIIQFFTNFLTIMSQGDFFSSIDTVLLLLASDRQLLIKNESLENIDDNIAEGGTTEKRMNKLSLNKCQIWFPNILKFVEGFVLLFISFFVIVRSESVIDLIKDFTALQVIATVDDMFFAFARQNYFGASIVQKAEVVEDSEI